MEDFKRNEILDSDYNENTSPWEGIDLASFWQRTGATLIDSFIIIAIVVINAVFIITMNGLDFLEAASSPGMFVSSLIAPAYKILMEGQYGATLGKMALRLRIVDSNAEVIDLNIAIRRYALYGISVIISLLVYTFTMAGASSIVVSLNQLSGLASLVTFISCLFVAFDDRKQALHDKIAETYVVQNNGESYGGGFN